MAGKVVVGQYYEGDNMVVVSKNDFPVVDGDNVDYTAVNSFVPIGVILPWLKTFNEKDSGTTDGTTTDKLVDSTQNFTSTVSVGDLVYNTTDDTFAYVTAVDSDTTLSIDSDIMASGEAYSIYATPSLPNNFVECNGQTLSDSDSVYNGATIPDLNSGTYRMLRGDIVSGNTGGEDEHTLTVDEIPAHSHSTWDVQGSNPYGAQIAAGRESSTTGTTGGGQPHNNLPAYYSVVYIMKIK